MAAYVVVGVCQEAKPVAQTQVLRRVLMGGISTNRCPVLPVVVLVRTGPSGPGSRNALLLVVVGSVWHTVGS